MVPRSRVRKLETRRRRTHESTTISYGPGSSAETLEDLFTLLEGGTVPEREPDPKVEEYFRELDRQAEMIEQLKKESGKYGTGGR